MTGADNDMADTKKTGLKKWKYNQ